MRFARSRLSLVLVVTAIGCAEVEADSTSQRISVACLSSRNALTTLHQWELKVMHTSAVGDDFTALLGGTVIFSRAFLNERLQGVQKMHVRDLQATVRVYAGATGQPVTLVPALPYRCLADPEVSCDPANNGEHDSSGNRENTDCDDPLDGFLNPCVQFVELETSKDCDGVCESLGAGQICRLSQSKSCAVEDLEIALRPEARLYSPDANATTVRFGWEEGEPTGASTKIDGTGTEVWEFLQEPSVTDPVGPIGLRASLEAPYIQIAFNCTMGVDSFDPEASGPVIVNASPTPPEMLLEVPIPAVRGGP